MITYKKLLNLEYSKATTFKIITIFVTTFNTQFEKKNSIFFFKFLTFEFVILVTVFYFFVHFNKNNYIVKISKLWPVGLNLLDKKLNKLFIYKIYMVLVNSITFHSMTLI